jgi:hypothetical protein
LEFDAAAFEDLAWWVERESIASSIKCNRTRYEPSPVGTTTEAR